MVSTYQQHAPGYRLSSKNCAVSRIFQLNFCLNGVQLCFLLEESDHLLKAALLKLDRTLGTKLWLVRSQFQCVCPGNSDSHEWLSRPLVSDEQNFLLDNLIFNLLCQVGKLKIYKNIWSREIFSHMSLILKFSCKYELVKLIFGLPRCMNRIRWIVNSEVILYGQPTILK